MTGITKYLVLLVFIYIVLCSKISTRNINKTSTKINLEKTNESGLLTSGKDISEDYTKSIQFETDVLFNNRRLENIEISHNSEIFIKENANITKENGRKLQGKLRKPFKLNMKQALIMNQVLNTYGLNDVNNTLCRNHINEFKAGLRALEPWALKMFDSSSKLMSGILGGNLAELGAFKQCLNINEETIYGPIRGSHCTLHIHPSDKLVNIVLSYKKEVSKKHFENLKNNILDGVKLTWSVCVPDSCTHEDVLGHFSKSIVDVTEGLNLTLSLKEEHCMTLNKLPKFTVGDYIYLTSVGLMIIIVIISTIVDVFIKVEIYEMINIFSLKQNASRLFSMRENKEDISCLHGMRFLSMCLVVYGHRFIHNMATPVVNYMDLVDWLESFSSTTVHGGTTTVDTFLLMSSILLSYTHLRFLAPLALAISTYVTVAKHFGGGPLYNDLIAYYQTTCGYFWWSSLLYIQPFVNPRHECVVQTWYLSVDMFWYYLSPLMLKSLSKNQTFGYAVIVIAYSVCTIINFYLAWLYKFNGQMPVTPGLLSTDYFAIHYTQPIVRGGPYILGLAFGYTLFMTKSQKVKIHTFTKITGWILVVVLLPAVVLITRSFRLEDFEYHRMFASLFLACHRSVWSFGLMWIIWCCQNKEAGIIDSILSWKVFKVLGRLCYNIFLFHYLFQETMQNSKKAPSYFSNFLSIFDSLGDMVVMVLLSIPLTLCFEYPFTRLCTLIFKPNKASIITKVKPQQQTIREI